MTTDREIIKWNLPWAATVGIALRLITGNAAFGAVAFVVFLAVTWYQDSD